MSFVMALKLCACYYLGAFCDAFFFFPQALLINVKSLVILPFHLMLHTQKKYIYITIRL